MDDISIVEMKPLDWERYRDVRLRSLLDSPDAFGSTHEHESGRTDAEWKTQLDPSAGPVGHPVLAFVDQAVSGLAWGRIDEGDGVSGFVFQMWVDPASRNRGVGKALLDDVIAWFDANGVATVKLAVTTGNSAAVALYESAGFVRFGELEPLREGSSLHIQFMKRQGA